MTACLAMKGPVCYYYTFSHRLSCNSKRFSSTRLITAFLFIILSAFPGASPRQHRPGQNACQVQNVRAFRQAKGELWSGSVWNRLFLFMLVNDWLQLLQKLQTFALNNTKTKVWAYSSLFKIKCPLALSSGLTVDFYSLLLWTFGVSGGGMGKNPLNIFEFDKRCQILHSTFSFLFALHITTMRIMSHGCTYSVCCVCR